MDIKIVFHPSGDWEGLYIKGILCEEGHSISAEDMIDALNTFKFSVGEGSQLLLKTRDLGNEEGFDLDFNFPLKYEDIDGNKL